MIGITPQVRQKERIFPPMSKIWLFFAVVLIAASGARAQAINAKSCSESDVQSALNSATAGSTVNIPAGTCTWTSPLAYTTPANLTIQGQTVCTGSGSPSSGDNIACTDQTTIVDGMSYTASDRPLMGFTTTSGTFRLTGISLKGNGSTQTYNGAIVIDGDSTSIRVDHSHFYNLAALTVTTNGAVAGVIDHNILNPSSGSVVRINGGNDSEGFGDSDWAAPTALGTSNFTYFEDNKFINGGNDCFSGGRWVIRYNTMIEQNGSGFTQTHPTGGSDRDRGCRAFELYGNSFSAQGETAFGAFFLSSGTGVVWGNTADSSSVSNFTTIHSMRRDNTTYSQTATPNGWGYCGTSFDGTGSDWDHNTNTSTGYRCVDQPGSGQGDLMSGYWPNPTNTVTKCTSTQSCFNPNEASEPVYEWMDTWAGSSGSFWNNYDSDVLINNSDYYVWCNPSSASGCKSFDGTRGVGSGTLASRPSTCTTGVAYWATDQGNWNHSSGGSEGELFKCTAANTWTLSYTPYTYPHPLIGTGSTGTNALNPPTGLTGNLVSN
jgi:hypothetical protein